MINEGESHKKQRLMQTPYTGAEAVGKLLKNFGQISEAVSRFGNTLNAIHIAAENIEHEFRNLASMMSMTRYSMSMSNNSPMYGAGAKRTNFPSPQERLIEFEVVERAKNNIRDQLKQERGEQPFKDNATRLDEYESFLEEKEAAFKSHKDRMDGLYKRDGKEPVTTETKINEYQKFLDEKFERLQTYLKKEVDLHASIQQARGINKVAIQKVIFDYEEHHKAQNRQSKIKNNISGSDYVSGTPDYSETPDTPDKKAAIVVLDFETGSDSKNDIKKDQNAYIQNADILQIAAEFRDKMGNVLETFNVFLDKRSNDINLPSDNKGGVDKFAGFKKDWQAAKDSGNMPTMEAAVATLQKLIQDRVEPGVTQLIVKHDFDTKILQNNNSEKNKLLQPVLGPMTSNFVDIEEVFKQLFDKEKDQDPNKQSATQRKMAESDNTSGTTNYDKNVFNIETMFAALKPELEKLANDLNESGTDLGKFHNALGDVRVESLLYLFATRKLKTLAKESAAKNPNSAKGSKGNTASSTNTSPKKPNNTYSSNGGVQKVEVVAPLPLPVIIVGGGANLGGGGGNGGGGNGGGGLPTFTVPLIDIDKFIAQSTQAIAKERENQAAAKAGGKPASGKNTTNTTNDFSGGKPPVPNDNFVSDNIVDQIINGGKPTNPSQRRLGPTLSQPIGPATSYSPIKDPDFVPSAGTPKTEQQVKDEEAYERQNRSTTSFIDPVTKPITVDPNQPLAVDPVKEQENLNTGYYSRLHYADIGRDIKESPSARKYGNALDREDPNEIESVQNEIQKRFREITKQLNMELSEWSKSETWSLWDIGKQLYNFDNEGRESNENYRIGNPLTDTQTQDEIVARHVGWENQRVTDPKNPLPSHELAKRGRELMDQAGIAHNIKEGPAAPAPVAQSSVDTTSPSSITKNVEDKLKTSQLKDFPNFNGQGWKLHLATDQTEEVSDVLKEMGLFYKVGKNSEQDGKDITVYIGDKDKANAVSQDISNKIGHLLKEPHGDTLKDDIKLADKVMGRFDISKIDNDFAQYGAKGFPLLNDDLLSHVINDGLKIKEKDKLKEEYDDRANTILKNKYGTYYTGTSASPVSTTPPAPAKVTPSSNLTINPELIDVINGLAEGIKKLGAEIVLVSGHKWGVADVKKKEDLNKEDKRVTFFVKYKGKNKETNEDQDVTLPMYRSSKGTSGKNKGSFYPYFGAGDMDWLVKGMISKPGKPAPAQEDILLGYNVDIIKTIQDFLSEAFKDFSAKDISNALIQIKGEPLLGANAVSKTLFGRENLVEKYPEKGETQKYLLGPDSGENVSNHIASVLEPIRNLQNLLNSRNYEGIPVPGGEVQGRLANPIAETPPAPVKEIPPVSEPTPPPKVEAPLSKIDKLRATQKDVTTPEPVAPPKPKAKPAPIPEANKEEGYYAGKHGIEFGFDNQSSAQATSSDFINNFIQGIPKQKVNGVEQPPTVLSDSMQDMMRAFQDIMLPVLNRAQLNTTAARPGAEGTAAFDTLSDSAQQLVSSFQKMFGLDLTKISNFSASAFGPDATKNNKSDTYAPQGLFNKQSGSIKIKQGVNETGKATDNSFGTLLHESIHAMFNQLRRQTKIPQLGQIADINFDDITGGNKEQLKAIEEMYKALVERAKTAFIESLAIQNYGDASPANIKNATKDFEGMEYFKKPEELIATMIGDTFKGKDKQEGLFEGKNKSWLSGKRKPKDEENTSIFSRGFNAVKKSFGFGNTESEEMADEENQTNNNSLNEILKEDDQKAEALRLADAESVLYDPASPSMANVGGNVETPFLEKDKNKPNALLSNQKNEIFKRDVSSASSEQLQADLDQIADLLQGPAKNSPLFLKMAKVQQTKINDQLNRLDAIKRGMMGRFEGPMGPFQSEENQKDLYDQLQFEREYKNLEQPTPAPAKALTATELIAQKKAELKTPEEPKKEDEKVLEKKDSQQAPGKRERGENISLMEALSQSFDRLTGKAYTKGYDPNETFDKRADGVAGVVSGAKDKASNLLDNFSGVPDLINSTLNSDIKIPFLPKEQTEEQRLNGGKTYSYTGYTTDEKGKKTETQGEISANSWTEAVQKLNEQGAIFVEKIAEVNGGMEGFIKNSLRPDAAVSEQNNSTVQYLDFLRDKLNTNEMNNSNTDGSLTDQGILESNKLLQEIVNTLIAIRGEKVEPAPQKMDAETEEIVNNRNLDNASQGAYSRETSQVAGDIISGGAGNKDTTKPIPFKIDTDNFPSFTENLDFNSSSEPYANLPFPNQPIIPFDSNNLDSNEAPKNAAPQSAEMAALLSGYQQEFPTSSLPVKNPEENAALGIPKGAIDPQNIITPNATEPIRPSLSPLDIGALLDPNAKPDLPPSDTAGESSGSKDVTVSGSVPIDVNVLNIGDIKPAPAPSSDSSSGAKRSVVKNKPIPGLAKGGIIGQGVNKFISKGFGSDEDEGPKYPDIFPRYLAQNEAVLPEDAVKKNARLVGDLLKGKKIKYMKKGGMGGGGSAPTATSSSSGSAPKFDPRVLSPKGDIFGPIKQWVGDFSNNTRLGFIGKSVMDFGKALQGSLNGIAGFVKAASPDAFSTLTGSIQLLMGAIGVQFIPIILRVSAILQSWYQDILMGEGVVGEFVAKVAGWINEMPEDMLEGLVGIGLVVAGIVALAPVFAGLMAVVGIVAGAFSLLMTAVGFVASGFVTLVTFLGTAFAGVASAVGIGMAPLAIFALAVLAAVEMFSGIRGPITRMGEAIGNFVVGVARKMGLLGVDHTDRNDRSGKVEREEAKKIAKAYDNPEQAKKALEKEAVDEREKFEELEKEAIEAENIEKARNNFGQKAPGEDTFSPIGNTLSWAFDSAETKKLAAKKIRTKKDKDGKEVEMTSADIRAEVDASRRRHNALETQGVIEGQKVEELNKEAPKDKDGKPVVEDKSKKLKELQDKADAMLNAPKPEEGSLLGMKLPDMSSITTGFDALGGKLKDAVSGLLTSGPNGKGKAEEYDRGKGLDQALESKYSEKTKSFEYKKINDKEFKEQEKAQSRRLGRIGTKDEQEDDKDNAMKFGKFAKVYTKQKEDEGNRKKEGEQKALAMSFSKEKAQASFSSVDEAYKKIQVSALGDDPMTAEMKKLNEIGMVKLLEELRGINAGGKQNADKIVAGGGLAK